MGKMCRGRAVSGAPGQVFQSSVHLPLRGVVAEVGHQTYPQGVCAIQALYDAQVARRLCQALPEAQAAVILGQSVSLKVPCQDGQTNERAVQNLLCQVI